MPTEEEVKKDNLNDNYKYILVDMIIRILRHKIQFGKVNSGKNRSPVSVCCRR